MRELIDRILTITAERAAAGDPVDDLAGLIREEAGVIGDVELLDILRTIHHATAGFGPLEQLLSRPGVTDVVVNGPGSVFVDIGAGMVREDMSFVDDAAVRRLATRLVVTAGGRLDDAEPFADARVLRPDGTTVRLHAVLSPPATAGTCLSLRVLRQASMDLGDLVRLGTVEPAIAELLREIVRRRWSFLVVGGTGSGKTTLLSTLLGEVGHHERVVCIEDTAELAPRHPHVVTLVTRRPNTEGSGEITLTDLLRQALRMRPDRIVVGEIRGPEVVDLLAALNTGHDGGAGTVHANSLEEVPARIEALAALGGLDRAAAHSQLTAAVKVVLVTHRSHSGVRKLVQIGVLERGHRLTTRVVWRLGEDPRAVRHLLGEDA